MSVGTIEFDMDHVYKKEPSFSKIFNKCHVIQIRTLTGKKICSCIYDNETLYDLYQKCYNALFNTTNVLHVEKYQTVRDEIPNQTYHVIHDIVLLDRNEKMLSVPCDKNILFYDFKRTNAQYFVPSSQIPVLSVYKVYVVDNESLDHHIKKQQNKQESVVDRMKRFIGCAF
jgi:hypothetical protein